MLAHPHTNTLQYRWLKLLAGPRTALFAVGDDDQSIYAFRGANTANMAEFEREFAHGNVIKLEQNYRSHGNILSAAKTLISQNAHRFHGQLSVTRRSSDALPPSLGGR